MSTAISADIQDDGPWPGLLRIETAARALTVTPATVYRMIGDGRLAAVKHSRNYYVSRDAITDYQTRLAAEAGKRRGANERRARGTKRTTKPRSLKAVAG